MLSEEQHAIDMRSSSPFPGVLTTKERTEALRDFERKWLICGTNSHPSARTK